VLYPQHGDRIVTVDSVTSLHPVHKILQQNNYPSTVTAAIGVSWIRLLCVVAIWILLTRRPIGVIRLNCISDLMRAFLDTVSEAYNTLYKTWPTSTVGQSALYLATISAIVH